MIYIAPHKSETFSTQVSDGQLETVE